MLDRQNMKNSVIRLICVISSVIFLPITAASQNAAPEDIAKLGSKARVVLSDMRTELNSLRTAQKPSDTERQLVSKRLIDMGQLDRAARSYLKRVNEVDGTDGEILNDAVWDMIIEVDKKNVVELRGILERHGWPSSDRFGDEAEQAAWLITQHMIFDGGTFQAEVLELLEPLVREGRVDERYYAYLSDRLKAIFQRQPQVYGTQGRCIREGVWEPAPIEAPENVDSRRAEIGIGPLKEQIARLSAECK